MDIILDLIRNPFLLTALSSWFVAQVIKTVIYAIINKKLVFERLVGDGGMPSGHSATVSSLATLALLTYGADSFEFALAGILAIIVCHDAMGVRRETGKQAVIINDLIKSFEIFASEELPETKLKEFVGHSPIQVAAGICIGILNAVCLNWLLF